MEQKLERVKHLASNFHQVKRTCIDNLQKLVIKETKIYRKLPIKWKFKRYLPALQKLKDNNKYNILSSCAAISRQIYVKYIP